MKKSLIYLLSIFVLLLILILIYSCADPGIADNNSQTNSGISLHNQSTTGDIRITNYFTKTVGAPIDLVKATRWVQNYVLANGQSFEYYIPSDVLQNILSNTHCVGISLRYGMDENNQFHIIPVGVDDTGTEIKAENISTTKGSISWEESKKYTGNYWGAVRSHFFGANTFERLFKSGDCKLIKLTAALDDNSQPQLLLTNASIKDTMLVEDESSPCPPHCETIQN